MQIGAERSRIGGNMSVIGVDRLQICANGFDSSG